MEEAEELADRVGIVDHGKLVALDAPKTLINNLKATAHLQFRPERDVEPREFQSIKGVLGCTKNGMGTYRLHITHASEVLPPLIRWATENTNHLHEIEIQRANLEDVFLSLTGSSLRE
jgi:ABC-2 type transport system ATP-binding protein